MIPLSSTENPQIEFNPKLGELSKKINIPTSKIGWVHTIADQKGASFDITIKDALGRVKFQRKNCSTDTEKFGELVNLPTLLGEELEVTVDNLKGAENLKVFIN
jgi:hypothetical protein